VQRQRKMMAVDDVVWRFFGPSTTGIMWWPMNAPIFRGFCFRKRLRFSSTSRMPTVI